MDHPESVGFWGDFDHHTTQRSSNEPQSSCLDDLLYLSLGRLLAKYIPVRSKENPMLLKDEYSSEVFPEELWGFGKLPLSHLSE